MVVFIYGWKYNVGWDDGNVVSFNKVFVNFVFFGVLGKCRLVGFYVGWWGKLMYGLYSENLIYWDRKVVVEEVGWGGVVELFVQLEWIDCKDRNYLVIVGYSFGGVIIFGVFYDLLFECLLVFQDGQWICVFGDVVIMLNLVIEVNQGLLFKENSFKVGVLGIQLLLLLYVISLYGDSVIYFVFLFG